MKSLIDELTQELKLIVVLTNVYKKGPSLWTNIGARGIKEQIAHIAVSGARFPFVNFACVRLHHHSNSSSFSSPEPYVWFDLVVAKFDKYGIVDCSLIACYYFVI